MIVINVMDINVSNKRSNHIFPIFYLELNIQNWQ